MQIHFIVKLTYICVYLSPFNKDVIFSCVSMGQFALPKSRYMYIFFLLSYSASFIGVVQNQD